MRAKKVLVCVALAVLCVLIYGQTIAHFFIDFDDPLYVTDNSRVQAGLSWAGVAWAFTTERAMYFHPLTWLSHMLDCELYGMRPWGHHLSNVLLHLANVLLLFLVLLRMTGRLGACAFAAALFGLHPLRVESVAWVAERKDVLSAFFWIAAMGCHTRLRQGGGRGWGAATALMFVLGLMSKPMVVTLPFALLLLDYWPLRQVDLSAPFRAMGARLLRLARENLHLYTLTLVMCAATLIMQERGNNLSFGDNVSLPWRFANAAVVYVIYLAKTLWPTGLAPYYPHPLTRPLLEVAAAAAVLGAITVVVLREARRRPYLTVGWFWFLGTLLPVIELVQAGTFSHADRYTYLPSIGLSIMIAFGLDEFLGGRRRVKTALLCATALALMVSARLQAFYWYDSETLFGYALRVTPDNEVSRNNYGVGLAAHRKLEQAEEQYRWILERNPAHTRAIDNIGVVRYLQGRYDEAIVQHRAVIAINPGFVAAHVNLGRALAKKGDFAGAEAAFQAAIARNPESVKAYYNLGELYAEHGRPDEAREAFAEALRVNPKGKPANIGMADVLGAAGEHAGAAAHYARALRTGPDDTEVFIKLGDALLRLGRLEEAAENYRDALWYDPSLTRAHGGLAVAAFGQGRIEDALRHGLKALEGAPGDLEMHRLVARALAAKGDLGGAEEHFARALQIAPNDIGARLGLAEVFLDGKRPEAARLHVEHVLSIEPENPAARALAARLGSGAAPAH